MGLLHSGCRLFVLVYDVHDASALFASGHSCVGVRQQLFETIHLGEGRVVGLESHEVGHRKTTGQDEKQEGAGRLDVLLLLFVGQLILVGGKLGRELGKQIRWAGV